MISIATLYRTDGEPTEIEPENGTNFQLEELYRLLEIKTVQIIELEDSSLMAFDENGKNINEKGEDGAKAFNHFATADAFSVLMDGDYIAGHALRCRSNQFR